MEQRMIMHHSIIDFEEAIDEWCELGWTVVPGTQGMWQEDRSTTDNSPREKYWVWMQDNRVGGPITSMVVIPEYETEDIDPDTHP